MNKDKAKKIFKIEGSLDRVSLEDVKKTFRKLALERHPDSSTGSQEKFVELKEAFEFLTEIVKNNSSKFITTIDTDPKNLKTLSKEEVIEKYNKDTETLQNQIQVFQTSIITQSETIEDVKTRVKGLVDEFENKKQLVQEELEVEISKLEKEYKGGLLNKFLFFLPKMSEDDFWLKYQEKVDFYTKKHNELDLIFLREMLAIYGEGLNKISEKIKEV